MMKRLALFLLVVVAICSLAVPAFARGSDGGFVFSSNPKVSVKP
jgi:hypothetical protein